MTDRSGPRPGIARTFAGLLHWLLAPAFLLLLLGCAKTNADPAPRGDGAPPVPVLVEEAARRSLPVEVSTVGSLRSPETTVVSADISGIIVELRAPEGKEIARGHLIARLDDSETKALLQVAAAREENARLELDRAQALVAGGVVSKQRLDDAVAEMRTAAGLLEEARTRLEKTRIKAPFAGLVGIQTAQLGQYVSSGDPIVELTQLDPLELIFGVPEEQAFEVRPGQKVQARVGRCGAPFEAAVEAIDPKIDPQSRTLSVQARVDNPERRLLPGMSARVRLALETETGDGSSLVVPREALVAEGSRYLVWQVDDEGRAQPAPVVPGRYLPDVVEIRQGLQDGATVVVAGHQKLRPGAAVAPSPWQPTANPNLRLGSRDDGACAGEA